MSHRILQLSVSKVEGDEELLEACLYFSNVCYRQKSDCTGFSSKPADLPCFVLTCQQSICMLACHITLAVSCSNVMLTTTSLLCHACSVMLGNACMHACTYVHQPESCMCGLMPTAVMHILAKASPDVMQHAPVAESNAAFPLVIFSHGIGGNRLAYSAIICSLVRQVSVTWPLPPFICIMQPTPCNMSYLHSASW